MFSFEAERFGKTGTTIAMCLLGCVAIGLAFWDVVFSPKQVEQAANLAGSATELRAELMKGRLAAPAYLLSGDAQYFAAPVTAPDAVEGSLALVQELRQAAMIREIIADAFAVTESARAASRLRLELAVFVATLAVLIMAFRFGRTWHDEGLIPIHDFYSLRINRRGATAMTRTRSTQPMSGKFQVEDWQCGEAC
jgi:hypothetical protein